VNYEKKKNGGFFMKHRVVSCYIHWRHGLQK